MYQFRLRSSRGGTAPRGEVSSVPVVHLEVEFAVPTIAGESGFLRRERTRALDRGEVLREHGTAFEFGRGGEIDGGAVTPEVGPVRGSGRERGGGCGRLADSAIRSEGAGESEVVTRWNEHVTMFGLALHLRDSGPGDRDAVRVVVEAAGESEVIGRGLERGGVVLLGMRPIGGAHAAAAVGEFEDNGDASADLHGEAIECGVAAGLDGDGRTAPGEFAVQSAGPEVERLLREADVLGTIDGEADAAEVKAMGIFAEPIGERLLAFGGSGVADFAAEGIELREAEIGCGFPGEIGRGVPAPLRLRMQSGILDS